MSHYTLAAIQTPGSDTIDELLAPYSENIDVEPYVDATPAEAIQSAKEAIARAQQRIEDGEGNIHDKQTAAHADDTDEQLLEWYADWYGQERDAAGNFLTTYNPQSKYDYYSEYETLTLEEWVADGRSDADEEELRQEWRKLSTEGGGFWNAKYYLDRYGDEDTYVKWAQLPAGWAILTPDGEWCEPGRVGWFAVDDATTESIRDWIEHFNERFVEPYDAKTTTVHLIDCHI